MAIGTAQVQKSRNTTSEITASPPVDEFVPVSILSNWVDVCSAPDVTDNSGSSIVNPDAITRAEQFLFRNNGYGSIALVRLKYDRGVSSPTDPVVQIFGRDSNGLWQKLYDASSPPVHEVEITVATSSDIDDGTAFKYTDWVEVDMQGCVAILVAVKTAFAGTGTVTNSTLQAKVK